MPPITVSEPREAQPMTYGERIDAISERMIAAYAARRDLMDGTPEYAAASDAIEAVYDDLRALNAEMGAGK